ncbi:antibiotic biosynthesis monooxygenase [Prauserella muralis]|uniref:ABM domain-containing protein n=1 Tax=Prauserella muralis TaxID=588067 RepID=A0A2V4APQ2_9PSEU|nr:antibiotic biosynthesis monooxygenase [Prauserella muralis]PXY22557.1 hypothetical protein BAY60_22225 [Prauserella muralis]TWE28247.1 antibiotic biosynthesis monooxygenase [Prauserella muralis]
MSVIRITRFTADPARAEELAGTHATLVAAVRAASPGPAEARLARLDEHTWMSVWRWDSAEDAEATSAAAASLPEPRAAFALVSDPTAEQGEIVDER